LIGPIASAEIQVTKFKVVGTWHNLSPFYQFEKPFWEKQVTTLSGGKITATINPVTELGLKGFAVARLLKLGVFDVAFASYGYVASEAPEIEGADLLSASRRPNKNAPAAGFRPAAGLLTGGVFAPGQLPVRTDEMAGVSVWDALQIILVFRLGNPEIAGGFHLGHDLARP